MKNDPVAMNSDAHIRPRWRVIRRLPVNPPVATTLRSPTHSRRATTVKTT
jgi:hypothetical protein